MNTADEQKRENRLKMLEDHIGRSLSVAEASGELQSAPSFGKPLSFGDGYDETPDALKMPFKTLKDAGMLPPEVQLMRDIAELAARLETGGGGMSDRPDRERLAALRQQLAMRLEALGGGVR